MAHLAFGWMISTVMTGQQWHLCIQMKPCFDSTSSISMQQALQNFEWPL